jgi:phosphate starvation-inducible protein PhoH and related proteins
MNTGSAIQVSQLAEETVTFTLHLEPEDSLRLANLCGQFDEHLKMIEHRLDVEISCRGSVFQVLGTEQSMRTAETLLRNIYQLTEHEIITPSRIHLILQDSGVDDLLDGGQTIITRRSKVRGRGSNQKQYLQNISTHDINFGIGPAGTGKTYLAVACAVDSLDREEVSRIVLTRPAVEAGERLGFLPGDLSQKIDPYLRPLYDALYEMIGFEQVTKLIERNVIEIAPLAYMRGRTLNDAFVILDEAQNTTAEQMKMFLTRIGFGSKAVITGDITQVDLPRSVVSGLRHAQHTLAGVEGIGIARFSVRDVIRHPLVKKIVEAYEQSEKDEDAP